jgi:hypothetical protein
MSKFDWETEGDPSWHNEEWLPADRLDEPRRRKWKIVGLVLVLLAAILFAFQQVARRVEDSTSVVRDDLLSTHRLLRYALLRGDRELFETLISGRDKNWTETQRRLFEEGFFLDRSFFGLSVVRGDGAEVATVQTEEELIDEIEFSANLMAAEVDSSVPYLVVNSDGISETVVLRQSAVYRRGSSRWLLSPPESEFWGEMVSHRLDYLDTTYPERDSELAERLARDLNGTLQRMCSQLSDLQCSSRFNIGIIARAKPDRNSDG